MGHIAERVRDLVDEDEALEDAIDAVLDAADASEDGELEWADVNGDLSSGQWGRLIEKGVLVDGDDGFVVADREEIETGLNGDLDGGGGGDTYGDGSTDFDDLPDPEPWSTRDKVALVATVGLVLSYNVGPVRNAIGSTIDIVMGPVEQALPFYMVILIIAMLTGVYSTLLQANLTNPELMQAYQSRMQDIQDRQEAAKEAGDDEAVERIRKEQMDAMGEQMSVMKENFRPMVYITLLSIPLFLWMYYMILNDAQVVTPQTMVFPMLGEKGWNAGVLGPMPAWIVWYFLCSMGFTQIIQKSLNIRTTPTT